MNKTYFTILIMICSCIMHLNAQNTAKVYLKSNSAIDESKFTLEDATTYDLFLKVFIEDSSTLLGFTTTLNDDYQLRWEFDGLERNTWVELKHQIEITDALVNPDFKIEMLEEPTLGLGQGDFYIDQIHLSRSESMSDNSLSVNEFEITETIEGVKIFPNPTTDYVTIINANAKYYRLYANDGKLIEKKRISSNAHNIPTNSFENGIYVLEIGSEDKTEVVKKIAIK